MSIYLQTFIFSEGVLSVKSSVTVLHTRSHNRGPVRRTQLFAFRILVVVKQSPCLQDFSHPPHDSAFSLYHSWSPNYSLLSVQLCLLFEIHSVVLPSVLLAVAARLAWPGSALLCLASAGTTRWESSDFLRRLQ